MKSIDNNLPVTFLYGSKSWTSKTYGYIIKECRESSYTDIKIISNAGHHIYSDNPDGFHDAVLDACKILKSDRKIFGN